MAHFKEQCIYMLIFSNIKEVFIIIKEEDF